MNRRSLVAILALAIAATACLLTSCGGLPGNAVARVGKVYIDNEEFTKQVESYAAQYSITKEADPASYKEAAAGVLESLIWTQVAVQKAPDLGITVTGDEIQAKIDSIVNDYYSGDRAALESSLKSDNMTLDDLGVQVSDYLLSQKVREAVTKDITSVSDQEVAAYYEANKASYLTEQTVDARHILVAVGDRVIRESSTTTTAAGSTTTTQSTTTTTASTAASESTTTTGFSDLAWAKAAATAAQVRLDLLSGGDWGRLAKQYSDDKPTKNSGGALGTVVQGDLVAAFGQEFDDVLFTLELNQVSEPLKTDNGYHIIQVTKITAPIQKTLEEAKTEIATTLVDDAKWAAWVQWMKDGMLEIGVTYRKDMRPTTTTTESPTTTVPAASTSTTAKP